MARMPTPDQIVKNWIAAMGSGDTQRKYKEGINRVTENPMAKAASPEAMDRYQRGVSESIATGRRAAKLNAVPMQRWQQNAANIGAAALATGAAKGKGKMQEAAQKWAPIYGQVSATVQAMPKGTRADSKARAAAAIDMLMDAAGRQ
jgi:hypothetical protein